MFNAPAVLAGQDPYTSATPIFDPSRPLTWDPSATTGQDGVIRARLTAALTVGDDDLTRLAGDVRAITGTDPPRPDPGRTPDPEPRRHPLLMDLGNLSWLYRLAAAARIFRLTVEEYLVLLRLMYHPGQDTPEPGSLVPAVDTVAAQRTRVEWFNRTAFTVYSALYVLEGIRAPQFRPPYTPDDLGPAITSLATAAEGARLTAESFTYGPITPARSQEVFHGLVTGKVITELGVLLDNGTRSQQAAAMFPLHPDSFTSAEWSQAAFAELKAADPPVLLPLAGLPAQAPSPGTDEAATLSRSFTSETDLSFLFAGEPDAANERNQVRAVLQRTRQLIDVTEGAFLFPVTSASFADRAIPPAQSARSFSQLAAHEPAYILLDPAVGQQRQITSYDGATRTATVKPTWEAVPGSQSAYQITAEVIPRTAASGGGLSTVVLGDGGARDDAAYTGMTVTITAGPGTGESRVITGYDGATQTATVDGAWVHSPDGNSFYTVTTEAAAGLVQSAAGSSLTLNMSASPKNGAYTGMTVTIVAAGRLSAAFGPSTDLGFLFTSQGSGQSRAITGYDGPTRAATVDADWEPVPDDTTCYLLTRSAAEGAARGGSSDTIELATSPSGGSGSYDGMTITLTGGTGAGQQSTVTAYDDSTRTATVSPPWTVKPDDTSTWVLTETVAQGSSARGGDANHLFLAPDASAENGFYNDMTLTLVPDPAAELKRGGVRQALLTVLAGIEHTAGVISAAGVLQQGYAQQGLAELLGTTPERLPALILIATRATDLADYLDEVLTPIEDGQVPADLPGFIAALSRALVLSSTLGISDAQARVVTEIPTAFNISDPRKLTFDNIISLSVFADLARAFPGTGEELIEYFRQPADTNDTGCPGPKVNFLSELTGWPAAQICQLSERFWPAAPGQASYGHATVGSLGRLSACFDLAARTGLNVASLLQLDALSRGQPPTGG